MRFPRWLAPTTVLSLLTCGCATQPPPPPRPDPLVSLANVLIAFDQTAKAAKQAPAIRADTAVLFPSRSQAIALSLLAYRAQTKAWPATKDDLRLFLAKNFPQDAPPESELADLQLNPTAAASLRFSFTRAGLPDEAYVLNEDGTISFSLTLAPHRLAALQPASSSRYSWGDFAAHLFIELPILMLSAKK